MRNQESFTTLEIEFLNNDPLTNWGRPSVYLNGLLGYHENFLIIEHTNYLEEKKIFSHTFFNLKHISKLKAEYIYPK